MHGIKHPHTGDLYELEGSGRVRVSKSDGRVGFYDPEGRWLAGDIFDVDMHLTGWIASPRGVHRMVNTTTH